MPETVNLTEHVTGHATEHATKKPHQYSHSDTRLQSVAIIIELSPQQKQQLFDRSQFRAELILVSQASLAYRKCLEQADRSSTHLSMGPSY